MKAYLPIIIVGLVNGSVYALAGMGLVLTFKTSGVFNFAHGAQAAAAAYVMYEFRNRDHWPWPLAALAALLLAGVLAGLVLERLGQALARAPTAGRVVATVGLLVGLQGVLVVVFGSATIPFRSFLPTRLVRLPGVNVRVEQLIVAGFVFVAAVALYLFFTRSRLGTSMQAVVDDPDLMGLMATSPAAVRRKSWIIGSSLAAFSGVLLAPQIGLDATILTLLVFYAFGAAAVGAFTSLAWTYLGGLVIGVGAAVTTKWIAGLPHPSVPLAALPSTLPFVVLFVVLLVTPKDRLVLRGSGVVRRSPPARTFPPKMRITAFVVGALFLTVLPHLVSSRLALYTVALAFVVLFASVGLLVRLSGQISLCHMAFAAVGASTFAHAQAAGLPWPVAALAAGCVAVPVGALVAIPAIRLSGVYLAIATFGFGLLAQRLFFSSFVMFGQDAHLKVSRPSVPGLHLQTDTGYYYVVLLMAVLCLVGVLAVRRSRLGRLLRALAETPAALNAHGANTNLTRLFAFAASAFLAGIGGALIAPVTGSATVATYDFSISLLLVAVLFVTGRQPVLSAFVAAAVYVVVPGYITNPHTLAWTPVIFGAGAIATVTLAGSHLWERLAATRRTVERRSSSPIAARQLPLSDPLPPLANVGPLIS